MAASFTAAGRVVSRIAVRNGACAFRATGSWSAAYSAACPGVGESRAVVIADDRIWSARRSPFGASPAAPGGRAIRKMPGQQERVLGLARPARSSRCRQSEPTAFALRRLGPELAVVGEIVPEQQRAGPPFGARPAAQVGDPAIPGAKQAEQRTNRPEERVPAHFRVRHEQTLERIPALRYSFVRWTQGRRARRAAQVDADRVVERKRDGYLGGSFAGIA